MFLRALLILLGSWLFLRLWRLISRSLSSSSRDEVKGGESRKITHPFRDGSIEEGEFEELEEKRESGGK